MKSLDEIERLLSEKKMSLMRVGTSSHTVSRWGDRMGKSSESIHTRVQAARNIQLARFSKAESSKNIVANADMRVGEIRQFCKLQDEGQSLMWAAMTQLNLLARVYHRSLKLARTIADLAGSEEIQSPHLAQALQCRPKIMLG